jgi:hypothetical protein
VVVEVVESVTVVVLVLLRDDGRRVEEGDRSGTSNLTAKQPALPKRCQASASRQVMVLESGIDP